MCTMKKNYETKTKRVPLTGLFSVVNMAGY